MGNELNSNYSSGGGLRFTTFKEITEAWNRLVHGKKGEILIPLNDLSDQRKQIDDLSIQVKPISRQIKIVPSISDRIKSVLYSSGLYREKSANEYKISRMKVLDEKLEKKQRQLTEFQSKIRRLVEPSSAGIGFSKPIHKELNQLINKQRELLESYHRAIVELKSLNNHFRLNLIPVKLDINPAQHELPGNLLSNINNLETINDQLRIREDKIKELPSAPHDKNKIVYRFYEFREFYMQLEKLNEKAPLLSLQELKEFKKLRVQVHEAAAELRKHLNKDIDLPHEFEECCELINSINLSLNP